MVKEKNSKEEKQGKDQERTEYGAPGLQNMKNIDPQDLEKQIPEEVKKEIEKTREKLQEFKKQLLRKFPFVDSLGILPPWASKVVEEEEEIIKEKDERLIHLLIIIPDEKAKEINRVKVEAINLIKDFKPRIWLHIKTKADILENYFVGKF
ncbi:MAG: hypothetical protein QXG18_02315 [Candidatus Pacearchaeota archaeon]